MVSLRRWATRPIGYAPLRFPPDAPKPWLNMGCGADYKPGWVNADIDHAGVLKLDAKVDMLKFPWPFENGRFGLVYMGNVLEHVPHQVNGTGKDGFLAVMEEIHRVLRPGGYAYFLVPHWEAEDNIMDPTHTRVVHPWNFYYFNDEYPLSFYTKARFDVVEIYTSRHYLRGNFLRMGKSRLTATEHLFIRAKWLRPFLVRGPKEAGYILRKA